MAFDPADPRITAYLLDELEAADKLNFESELKHSAELREMVQQIGAVIDSLRTELSGQESLRLTDEQRSVIDSETAREMDNAKVERARPERDAARRSRWIRIGAGCALSGLFVVIAWSGYISTVGQVRRNELSMSKTTPEFAGSAPVSQIPLSTSPLSTRSVSTGIISNDSGLGGDRGRVIDNLAQSALRQTHLSEMKAAAMMGVEVEVAEQDEATGFEALGTVRDLVDVVQLEGLDVTIVGRSHDRTIRTWELAEGRPRIMESAPDLSFNQSFGAGAGGDKHELIVENEFQRVHDAPLSTFSIDVDTASYSKVRMYLDEHNRLPRPDAVRIEELINYFNYEYGAPEDDQPFAANQAVIQCPWAPAHHLVRIGIKGREIEQDQRPASNLVFLLDVSGSMDKPNKLPLLKRGMKMLADQLSENDRVAIVVYAGAAGMVLDSTLGDQRATIVGALDRLKAGGSTNGGAGIQLAYQTALDHFIAGGVNRVILCTDGDFNVGTTGTDELVRTVEQHAKSGVFLSVIGFGMGNHNDSMLEQISNKGNGNYSFVDTKQEAHKVLVEQMSGTLVTIAKDVKIQIEFNPAKVAAYRLIGYENRVLAAQDFNDDTKDAGEIGAGHTVTALYEIVPAGSEVATAPPVDGLKYQSNVRLTETAEIAELLTLKIRYKEPDGDTSSLLTFPLAGKVRAFHEADRDFQFAAAVASFGMLLRNSEHAGNASFASVLEIATPAAKNDASGYRSDFLRLVRTAGKLAGEPAE
jgi:secreted protein with Ig-like and vWFA domain